jgi:serine/threonine-protein kinase
MARANQPIVAPFGVGALAPIIDAAGVVDPDDRPDAAALAVMLDSAARQLDAPAPIPVTPVLNLDARTPSAADPTEVGVTATLPVVDAPVTPVAAPVVGRKSRRRVGWVIAALAVVAAVVMAALYAPILLKPKHDVPTLRGETLAQAAGDLAPLKFKLASTQEYSDTVPGGEVISQTPQAGKSLREDETVRVVVSKGPPPVQVPSLSGLTEDAAIQRITAANLKADVTSRPYNEDVPQGTVIDWNPKGEAPKGSTVSLTVSNGPEPRRISNWTGKTFDETQAALVKAGLKVKRVEGYSDTIAQGLVISTSPGAGETVVRGSTVTVTVCVGTATVPIPNVSGQTVDQATTTLQQAGLAVGGVFGPNGKNRHVFFTSPGPGTRVNRGTSVNLYVQ